MPEVLSNTDTNKRVDIDFTDTRRKSFLPDGFGDSTAKRDVNLKTIKVLECQEDDDLFMYMGSSAHIYENRPMKKFCTGSKYLGQWNKLGIAGRGIYKFPHGVIYDGYFNRNGEFHGTGILVYPSGQRIEGIWKNGILGPDTNFITKAGVMMSKNYCVLPDRRFQIELETDLNPTGQEYLTDEHPPPRVIPDDCFDVVEGFFDPKVKTVYAYPKDSKESKVAHEASSNKLLGKKPSTKDLLCGDDERAAAIREVEQKTQSEVYLTELMMRRACEERKVASWIPSSIQEDWIVRNCRKAWDEATEYRPDLYEEWTKGAGAAHKIETEASSQFISTLETLQLSDKKPKRSAGAGAGSKLISFVKNRQDEQEAVAIDMLTKMFTARTTITRREPSVWGASVETGECRIPGEER